MPRQPGPARIGWLIGVVVALAVVAGVGRLLAAPSGPAPADAPVVVEGVAAVGRPAPQVELPGLRGGRVRLADLRGRPAVVNFWASWCSAPGSPSSASTSATTGRRPRSWPGPPA